MDKKGIVIPKQMSGSFGVDYNEDGTLPLTPVFAYQAQVDKLQSENAALRGLLKEVATEYRMWVNQTNEGLINRIKEALNS